MTNASPSSARRDFRLLWTSQSLTVLGDQFLVLALPLVAVGVLGAAPAEAALLPFALFAPYLVVGLPAGAIVDRLPRRTVMVGCDGVQVVVFALVFLLATAGSLTFPVLLVLVAIAGSAAVFYQVAYTSYLPELFSDVGEIHRGNARLFLSESLARTLGPVLAGPVIAALGALSAIAVDAASFAASLMATVAIRHREDRRRTTPRPAGWLISDIRAGIAFVVRHDQLEPVISCGAVYVVFSSALQASLVLYARDVLGLDPVTIGLVAGSVIHSVGEGSFGPTSLTLRQTVAPPDLLGRVNAVQRVLIWGMIPIGSLLAFGIIDAAGLEAAVWVGALGTVLCLPLLVRRGIASGVAWRRSAT